ncbi:MAG: LptF/LptG family permease [Treponemataceae bacterium]|nr:MAG: LptF/LptG family permease [Treponemataceae bacterium]
MARSTAIPRGLMARAITLRAARVRRKRHVLLKYLLTELLLYFFIAFLFFFIIFFVNQLLLVAENILKMHVPVKDVALLITYSLPFIIAQSAPFATLVGFLVCFGRLVSDNEIFIFRASGHSYALLLVPVMLLGSAISAASFLINDYLLPLATVSYGNLYRKILYSNPGIELEPHSIKRTNESTLVIGDVTGQIVSDLVFFDFTNTDSWRVIVAGKSLVAQSHDRSVLMQLEMENAVIALFDPFDKTNYDVISSGAVRMNIFNSTIFPDAGTTDPRRMTAFDLHKYIKELKQAENIDRLQINMFELEFHKKFSLPSASLFFALLALPFAVLFGSRNGQTVGFVFGIFICVFYWAMMIVGQIASSRTGFSGIVTMWFPNTLVGIAGILCYLGLKRK